MIKAKEIKIVPIDNLIPNPKNANVHTLEQLERLSKMVDFQGFRMPLVVSNRSGFVVCGHGRLEMAKLKKMKELPVIYQDYDSEAQEYAHMVSDNEIARWAKLDTEKVNTEALSINELDLDMLVILEFSVSPVQDIETGEVDLVDEMNKKFILEITLPNEMELSDMRDDLTSRGYIVREK